MCIRDRINAFYSSVITSDLDSDSDSSVKYYGGDKENFDDDFKSAMNKKGDNSLNIVLDKQVYENINIIYKGKNKVTNQNKKSIDCIHFQINLIEGTIFKANETMDVFVSDDANRIPIYVEAEILVGSIRVYSKVIKGTKVPMRYLN
mgnify:CR=1 FL=1